MQRFKHLFDVNEKHGSFYLQSKVYRAKEALEEEYKEEGRWDASVEQPEAGKAQGEDQQKPLPKQ